LGTSSVLPGSPGQGVRAERGEGIGIPLPQGSPGAIGEGWEAVPSGQKGRGDDSPRLPGELTPEAVGGLVQVDLNGQVAIRTDLVFCSP
jgi:hypothetical protein